MLTLYQAEWCPYSSAVRQRLTELGIDFVAKQVAPRQEDRDGEHEIPLLMNGDGERFEETEAIFEFLESLAPSGKSEQEHRAQYRAHRPDRARETTAGVLAERAPLNATPAESALRARP
jgi:glutathione S-transferase